MHGFTTGIYFKRLLLSNEVHTMYMKHSFFLLLNVLKKYRGNKILNILIHFFFRGDELDPESIKVQLTRQSF